MDVLSNFGKIGACAMQSKTLNPGVGLATEL